MNGINQNQSLGKNELRYYVIFDDILPYDLGPKMAASQWVMYQTAQRYFIAEVLNNSILKH